MNIQIYSNTKNQEGDVNYNNKFALTLPEPIDGENKTRYIRALNVTYPLMINNLQEKTCGIRFKHRLFWNSHPTVQGDYIIIETDWIYLTPGRYTLKKLIRILNAISQEFGIDFSILAGGHVGVSVDMEPKYIYRYNNTDKLTYTPYYARDPTDFSFEMNKDLKYILGMDKVILHPEVQDIFDDGTLIWIDPTGMDLPPTPLEQILCTLFYKIGSSPVKASSGNKLWYFFYGKYSADITNGITRLFVYCDEVVPSIVGNVRAPLLAQLSLQTDYDKSVGLYTHDLPDISRELINTKIKNLHIRICDVENNLIRFNGGSVGIECIIE
jgi:hypothetical protein